MKVQLRACLLASSALLASGALAADLPSVRPAAAPAPVFVAAGWTGFYIGGHIGWGRHDGNLTAFTPWNGFAGFPVSGLSNNSVIGGVQAGYNYQMGSIVAGVEADFSAGSLGGSSNNGGPGTWWSSRANWVGTIGPRLGVAFGDALLYAKGGLAIADLEYSHVQGGNLISAGSTRTGWMIGAGLEYAINRNLSLKVEYNYIDLGGGRTTLPGAPVIWVQPNREIQTVKFGFNYRFSSPASAVVASY